MAVHGEDHEETVNSMVGLAEFLEDPCPAATVLDIRFRTFGSPWHVSKNLTSAGAREDGGGTGTSAFGWPIILLIGKFIPIQLQFVFIHLSKRCRSRVWVVEQGVDFFP